MRLPPGVGAPVGGLGTGKIDFFADLTIGNLTIANNWSRPVAALRGFHLVELESGVFLQGDPLRYSEYKYPVRTPRSIEAEALYPEVRYTIRGPDFQVRVFSPFVPGDLVRSSVPAVVVEVRGKGVVALSFQNIVGTRRWGRVNEGYDGYVSGVVFRNPKASQADPAYGEMFIGCRGCRWYTSYRIWVPAPVGMMENTRDLSLDVLERGSPSRYEIERYAREEIGGIVWAEVDGVKRFYITWFFNGRPSHYPYGHYYENWFNGAVDVAEFVEREQLDVKLWEPRSWIEDMARNELYVLSYSWLTRDGRLAIYEDPQITLLMNTIGSMTWDGASFALLDMFPELVKRMDEYFGLFVRGGEVPHDYGEESLDEPIYGSTVEVRWKDLGPTWILMMYRDYALTKDLDFLRRNFDRMAEVARFLESLDRDGDGLPDHEGRYDSSYDGTNIYGAAAYSGMLYACAMKAMAEAARALGRDPGEFEAALERARRGLSRLWNGRYYIAWDDGRGNRNDSCMNSQVLGEFWCEALGLGNVLPENVDRALQSIYELNYRASRYCTVNSARPDGSIDRTSDQMRSCWPRVNFAVAAHMILRGRLREGAELAWKEWSTISSRYPYDVPSKIDADTGDRFGLPFYIGSAAAYLVLWAIRRRGLDAAQVASMVEGASGTRAA